MAGPVARTTNNWTRRKIFDFQEIGCREAADFVCGIGDVEFEDIPLLEKEGKLTTRIS